MYWFAAEELANSRMHDLHLQACRERMLRIALDSEQARAGHPRFRPPRLRLRRVRPA